MANPRLNLRSGLASRSDGKVEQVAAGDLNQIIDARRAAARLECDTFGGPGRYLGGAEDETDLGAGGTTYPAFGAWIEDTASNAWPVRTLTPKAIDVQATGSVKLYAVLETQDGVSPPAAVGAADAVAIVAQAAADPAPDNSLLLGAGTVTGAAVTSFTAEAAIPWPPEPPDAVLSVGAYGDGTTLDGAVKVEAGDNISVTRDDAHNSLVVALDGALPGATDLTVDPDTGEAVELTDGEVLTVQGAAQGISVAGNATAKSLTPSLVLAAVRPGLELDTDEYGAKGWRVVQGVARASLAVIIGDGQNVISAGVELDIYVPFDCTIVAGVLLADQVGNIEVDIWRRTFTGFPPAGGYTICGGNPLTATAANKVRDTSLTDWSKSLLDGDTLRFHVNSVDDITRCHVALVVERG